MVRLCVLLIINRCLEAALCLGLSPEHCVPESLQALALAVTAGLGYDVPVSKSVPRRTLRLGEGEAPARGT